MDVLMYATDELLQDSALLTSSVMNNVPKALIVKTEGEVFNGTGAGEMRGIVGAGGTVTVAKETGQTAATIVAENILNMWKVALPGPTDYAWYCTRVVGAELQQMDKAVGTGGELVYMPPGGLSGVPYATLMGDPVVIVPYTSALGTVGDIIYGAMSKYRYIDKGSILAAQSMHVRFIQSEMTFKWTLRNDGQPEQSNTVTSYNSEISQGYFVELATRA
jgi:HK97 family phage major capsid protein